MPVGVFSRKVHATSGGTGSEDKGVTGLRFLVFSVFTPEFERSRREI